MGFMSLLYSRDSCCCRCEFLFPSSPRGDSEQSQNNAQLETTGASEDDNARNALKNSEIAREPASLPSQSAGAIVAPDVIIAAPKQVPKAASSGCTTDNDANTQVPKAASSGCTADNDANTLVPKAASSGCTTDNDANTQLPRTVYNDGTDEVIVPTFASCERVAELEPEVGASHDGGVKPACGEIRESGDDHESGNKSSSDVKPACGDIRESGDKSDSDVKPAIGDIRESGNKSSSDVKPVSGDIREGVDDRQSGNKPNSDAKPAIGDIRESVNDHSSVKKNQSGDNRDDGDADMFINLSEEAQQAQSVVVQDDVLNLSARSASLPSTEQGDGANSPMASSTVSGGSPTRSALLRLASRRMSGWRVLHFDTSASLGHP